MSATTTREESFTLSSMTISAGVEVASKVATEAMEATEVTTEEVVEVEEVAEATERGTACSEMVRRMTLSTLD